MAELKFMQSSQWNAGIRNMVECMYKTGVVLKKCPLKPFEKLNSCSFMLDKLLVQFGPIRKPLINTLDSEARMVICKQAGAKL